MRLLQRTFVLLGPLCLAACAHLEGRLPAEFRRVNTEHVVLRTTLGSRAAQRTARDLESRYQVIADNFFPCAASKRRRPVEVTLLHRQEFAEIRPEGLPSAVAYYTQQSGGIVDNHGQVVMQSGRKDDLWFRVFQHELAHHLAALCHAELPPWLAEGLAMFVETAAHQGGELILGTPAYIAVEGYTTRYFRMGSVFVKGLPAADLPSVAQLVNMGPAEFYRDSEANYAAAAILVRALELAEGDMQQRYQRFMRALVEADGSTHALGVAFGGMDLQHLFDVAARSKRWQVRTLDAPVPVVEAGREAPMSPADTYAHRARLWGWEEPARLARAHREVRQGLAVEPDHTGLRLLDLQILVTEARLEEAAEAAAAWLARAPDSVAAVRAALEVTLLRASASAGEPSEREAELRSLRSALQKSGVPRDIEVCARASLALDELPEARVALQAALDSDASCAACWLTLALVDGHERRFTQAERHLRRALVLAGESDRYVWHRAMHARRQLQSMVREPW